MEKKKPDDLADLGPGILTLGKACDAMLVIIAEMLGVSKEHPQQRIGHGSHGRRVTPKSWQDCAERRTAAEGSLFGRPESAAGGVGADGMTLVDFLDARIGESKQLVLDAAAPPSLVTALLREQAQEREMLAAWREAARAEGIVEPDQAEGTMSLACRSMLTILAAGYKTHPDYRADWGAVANLYPMPAERVSTRPVSSPRIGDAAIG